MNSHLPKSYFILLLFFLWSCSEARRDSKVLSSREKEFYSGIGFGPITQLTMDSLLNPDWSENGKEIFNAKCSSCHSLTEERKIGPGLLHVTLRRRPEWIMNQILNPLENTQKDSMAMELLSIYLTQMVPMNVSNEEARYVLEYLRQNDLSSK